MDTVNLRCYVILYIDPSNGEPYMVNSAVFGTREDADKMAEKLRNSPGRKAIRYFVNGVTVTLPAPRVLTDKDSREI